MKKVVDDSIYTTFDSKEKQKVIYRKVFLNFSQNSKVNWSLIKIKLQVSDLILPRSSERDISMCQLFPCAVSLLISIFLKLFFDKNM